MTSIFQGPDFPRTALGERRDPPCPERLAGQWAPAFAGVTAFRAQVLATGDTASPAGGSSRTNARIPNANASPPTYISTP